MTIGKSSYSEDEIKPISFEDAVRRRPGIFFGSYDGAGVINLVKGVIIACIELVQTTQLLFTISLEGENSFIINIDSDRDLFIIVRNLLTADNNSDNYHLKALKPVSKRLELSAGTLQFAFFNNEVTRYDPMILTSLLTEISIKFELDEGVFRETFVNYHAIASEVFMLSVLNRGVKMIVRDTRQIYLSQNYYHFPEGVFYWFDRILYNSGGKPSLNIRHEADFKENKYQIAIANAGWPWVSSVSCFANDVNTINGGSHVDGVVYGIVSACKRYVKENGFLHYKINKKNVLKGFTIVCSVRGAGLEYGGSMKDKLLSNAVYHQLKKIVADWIYNYLQNDNNLRNIILSLFDQDRLFPFEK